MSPRRRRILPGALVLAALFWPATASAAPGYRWEINPDATYAAGGESVVTGPNNGRGVTAPFPVRLYDTERTQLFVHTRGFVLLGGAFSGNTRTCLPASGFSPAVFPFWSNAADQSGDGPGNGVYKATDGVAPNRRFILDWRVFKPASGSQPAVARRFAVVFHEGSKVISTFYSGPLGGSTATIGVSNGPAGPHTEYSCGSTSIPGGLYRLDYIPDPRNLSPPAISGTPRVGQPLDGSTGTWDGTGTIAFDLQWQRCDSAAPTVCTDIASATAASYTPTADDVNRRLRLRVKATTMQFPYVYDDTAQSGPTGLVAPAAAGAAPRLTALAVRPSTLTPANRSRARIDYGVSTPATAEFRVQRAASGRRRGSRCVAVARARPAARRCTRYVTLRGLLRHVGGVGANSVAFRGRIGGRTLRRGRYRVRGIARAADGRSSPARTAGFRVR